nr:RuBisCO long chain, Form III-b [uncultured archaeon]
MNYESMAGYEDFINTKYKPKSTDLLVSFKVKIPKGVKKEKAIGAVASESSVGTWASTVKGSEYSHVKKVAGTVYFVTQESPTSYWTKIAYPQDHFEPGNMSQILASIAGNVFGMKAVDGLRIEDIKWPAKIRDSFPGPQFGIDGIRKIFKVKKRPLLLSVPKPKVGMTTPEHCEIGRQIWSGGIDLLKDDENLSSQKFNPFEKRVRTAVKIRDRIEKETGDKKSYLINITHSSYKEMEKRAKLIADLGWEYVMIDIVTTGFSGVHSVRELCQDLGLAIHAHRAMHASFTRNPDHGFSMLALAETSRLLGVDNIHIGTAGVGKLVGTSDQVLSLQDHITGKKVKENKKLRTLGEDWGRIKPVFPVSSGGLHPGVLPDVMKKMGTNIMIQAGGGIHGHPGGSHAGAIAVRQAVEAYLDGETLDERARKVPELQQALTLWGKKHIK